MSAACRASSSRPTPGRRPGGQGAAHRRAEGARRRDRQARRAARRAPRRRASCWPPTARCAGRARRSPASWPARRCCKPRTRLLADEQLTGAARDQVQARLDLWLKAHVEKLLGPLFDARQRRGPHRHRPRPRLPDRRGARRAGAPARRRRGEGARPGRARAALRKLGVRFGAYHLYRAGAAEARAARPRRAALGAEAWRPRAEGARRPAAPRLLRPHLDPGRQGGARRRSTAPSATASAASARCASTSSSGSPT